MKRIITALFILLSYQSAFSYDEENYESYEESYDDYDSIVGDLSSHTSGYSGELINLDAMKLHAGFGFNNTIVDLKSHANNPDKITLQGFQLSLGVDLFSPNVITEVGLINYNSVIKDDHKYGIKEFDLKTYYRYHLNRIVAIRGGAGLGVRYLDVKDPEEGESKYTNPVSQILVGGEAKLGKKLSFVTELSYKNSMTSSTPEHSSTDLTFRVDGHF